MKAADPVRSHSPELLSSMFMSYQQRGVMTIRMKATVTGLAALALALAVMPALGPVTVQAQAITTGTIEVRITDETKAVLPGVTVTVTNPDTGLTRNGVSDARGIFQFLNVPLGNN